MLERGLKRNVYTILAFITPALVLYLFFMWIPAVRAFYLSFFHWTGLGAKSFTGLDNYRFMLGNAVFRSSVKITVLYMLINVPLQISTAYVIAYLLYLGVRGFKVFRFIYFMPVVLLTVAVGIVFDYFLSAHFGIFKPLFASFGVEYRNPLAFADTALITAILADWWKWLGTKIMLFYAGFQGMSLEVLEAATIDGATGRKMFIHIILPLSWEILTMVIVLLVIGSLKVFNLLFVMTQGGPNGATEVLTIHLYRTAFGEMNFGVGNGIAVILFILTFAITLLMRKTLRREVY
ncbi:MAG: sugar ABC transporter permease [Spirochaetales bacterium]